VEYVASIPQQHRHYSGITELSNPLHFDFYQRDGQGTLAAVVAGPLQGGQEWGEEIGKECRHSGAFIQNGEARLEKNG